MHASRNSTITSLLVSELHANVFDRYKQNFTLRCNDNLGKYYRIRKHFRLSEDQLTFYETRKFSAPRTDAIISIFLWHSETLGNTKGKGFMSSTVHQDIIFINYIVHRIINLFVCGLSDIYLLFNRVRDFWRCFILGSNFFLRSRTDVYLSLFFCLRTKKIYSFDCFLPWP